MPRLLSCLLLCCSLLFGSAHAQSTLSVGYLPIMPLAQIFVIAGEGWDAGADLQLDPVRFTDREPLIQALLDGELDAAYLGIGNAMEARLRGAPVKVVAAAVKDQVGVVVRGPLAELVRGVPVDEAIARFSAEQGRRPVFAAFPEGSVPNTILRFWLTQRVGLDPAAVEIRAMAPAALSQALLAGQVDAAATIEPDLTMVGMRDEDIRVLTWGAQLLSNHPGGVLAVTEDTLENRAGAVERLVALHIRATEMLRHEPALAVDHVLGALEDQALSAEEVGAALRSPFLSFLADPRRISASTVVLHDFWVDEGTLEASLKLDELFDFSVFQRAARR